MEQCNRAQEVHRNIDQLTDDAHPYLSLASYICHILHQLLDWISGFILFVMVLLFHFDDKTNMLLNNDIKIRSCSSYVIYCLNIFSFTHSKKCSWISKVPTPTLYKPFWTIHDWTIAFRWLKGFQYKLRMRVRLGLSSPY